MAEITLQEQPGKTPTTTQCYKDLLTLAERELACVEWGRGYGDQRGNWRRRVGSAIPSQLECHALQRILRANPASPKQIKALLGRLALHYPHQQRSKNQWRLVFEDLIDDLGDATVEDLVEGCAKCRRSTKFFPSTKELLEAVTSARRRREILDAKCLWLIETYLNNETLPDAKSIDTAAERMRSGSWTFSSGSNGWEVEIYDA